MNKQTIFNILIGMVISFMIYALPKLDDKKIAPLQETSEFAEKQRDSMILVMDTLLQNQKYILQQVNLNKNTLVTIIQDDLKQDINEYSKKIENNIKKRNLLLAEEYRKYIYENPTDTLVLKQYQLFLKQAKIE